MFKHTLRLVLAMLLVVTVLAGWNGVAQAYLKGAPGAPQILAPGDTPDYLTAPNWAYSPPLRKFVDPLPLLCVPEPPTWSNCDASVGTMNKNIPVAIPDIVTYPGSDYYELELVEFSEPMHSDLLANPTTLRGYRQVGSATDTSGGCTDPALDPLNTGGTNCQTTDNLAFPVDAKAHYLGPIIVAQKNRPVRVKFINGLPTGIDGELFVPVDQTIMGSGDYEVDYDPITKELLGTSKIGKFSQNRAELHLHGGRTPWISDGTPHQWITPAGENPDYSQGVSMTNVPDMADPGPGAQTYYWTNQQSARLLFYHDHSWGTTRLNVYVGGAAGYLIQDETEQALIADGILTSAEIPLVIQDKTFVDATPVDDPYNTDPAATIPQIYLTDPTWRWGMGPVIGTITEFNDTVNVREPQTGDLWWPHVYMPAQNPFDITGIAPMGRWAFGPYFWPATNNPYQPVPNPYFNPDCDAYNDYNGDGTFDATDIALNEQNIFGYTTINGVPFCQPWEIPATPNPSWGAEAFMDTPLVNGTAYPVLNVDPKAYRFRVLNAAHDRFFNLSMFVAADGTSPTTEDANGVGTVLCDQTFAGDPANCTEVKMLPAVVAPGMPATWPADGRPGGYPDWTTAGPNWLQIGTEGGFLPQPVEIQPQPVTWNNDVTTFNAGNVNGGSLILGPAERADVIVDFSAYAGKTLILYNDAPAPWPALDPHYDYFTGAPDMTDAGGAPPTLPGFGPNTRTVMKIVVADTAPPGTPVFDPLVLKAAFDPAPTAPELSVFEKGQDPLIVGQGNLNPTGDPAFYEAYLFEQPFNAITNTYDRSFPTVYPNWGIAQINSKAIYFHGVDGSTTYAFNAADNTPHPLDSNVDLNGGIPLMFKAIQDEQGETFDDYGRMRAGLGLEIVNPGAGQVNFIVQTYSDPSTEILEENGIQVWKITHNGVDTHPVHFHLYDVQVINRVGWDGFVRLPDPNELGWKDTVRISPLEDTIVALKPVTPLLPFGVPESVRPLNPARPLGDQTELTQIDPYTGEARSNLNRMYNLDWEYVWHCHILSHEENDMMRNQSFLFQELVPAAPTGLAAVVNGDQVDLTWTDPTPAVDPATPGNPQNEIGFRVERALQDGFASSTFDVLGNLLANATSYTDTTADTSGLYYEYRVVAYNARGDSPASGLASIGAAASLPAATPTVLTVPTTDADGNYTVTWNASATAGATYVLEEATDPTFAVGLRVAYSGPDLFAAIAGRAQDFTYYYRIKTLAPGFLESAWLVANKSCAVPGTTQVAIPNVLTVPTADADGNYTISWGRSATAGVIYVLEEATDPIFATNRQVVYVGTARTAAIAGRAQNFTYYYRVMAIKAGLQDSRWRVAARGCAVPGTSQVVAVPANGVTVPATDADGSYVVSWLASPTAGAIYWVEEATNNTFTTALRTAYFGPNQSAQINGRPAGNTYYYRVQVVVPGLVDSNRRSATNGCLVGP